MVINKTEGLITDSYESQIISIQAIEATALDFSTVTFYFSYFFTLGNIVIEKSLVEFCFVPTFAPMGILIMAFSFTNKLI